MTTSAVLAAPPGLAAPPRWRRPAPPPAERIPWPRVVFPALAILYMGAVHTYGLSIPRPVLLVVAAAVLGAVFLNSLRDPTVALLALAAYIPFSRVYPGNFGGEITALNLTNVLTGIAILAWLVAAKQRGTPLFPRAPLSLPVWLFVILSLIAFLRGGMDLGIFYWEGAINNLKRWLDPFLIYFLFLGLVRRKATMRNLVTIILIAVLTATLMGFVERPERIERFAGTKLQDRIRIEGIASQPNQLGAFFVYYGGIFAGLALTRPWSLRHLLLLVPVGLTIRAVQYTGSRGALLGVAVAGMTFWFLRSKLVFIGLALLIAVVANNPELLPQGTQQLLGRTLAREGADLQESLDRSAAMRIKLWDAALLMIQDEPLLGVGHGLAPRFVGVYNPEVGHRDVHNMYLLIAAEMGIPALLVFLWILGVVIRETLRLYRRTPDRFFRGVALGFTAGLGGLLVANLFGSRIASFEIFGYFWILAAIVMRANALERAEQAALATAQAPAIAPWVRGVPALSTKNVRTFERSNVPGN